VQNQAVATRINLRVRINCQSEAKVDTEGLLKVSHARKPSAELPSESRPGHRPNCNSGWKVFPGLLL
jgi:hypothetical protein